MRSRLQSWFTASRSYLYDLGIPEEQSIRRVHLAFAMSISAMRQRWDESDNFRDYVDAAFRKYPDVTA